MKIENCKPQIDRLLPQPAWWWLPWLAGWCVFLAVECFPVVDVPGRITLHRRTPVEWLLEADLDVLVYVVFLVTAPFLWWLRGNSLAIGRWSLDRLRRRIAASGEPPEPASTAGTPSISMPIARPMRLSLLVAMVSLAASAAVGAHFDDLPPAYHDEYSYLFQAQTYLAGRVSYPSHVAARLFDQMHVLNEGRFASRFFPGTGLWMAPFVAVGHPYWGHWLAGAICAVLMFWIGRELAGDAGGLIAGLLTACSPGMALFSNLLLAHHPTLVGLGVFLLGFFRMVRLASWKWGLVSGTGLAFAMLCRPLTAAGVGLPFGIWFLTLLLKRSLRSPMTRRPERERRFNENLSAPVGRQVISQSAALALPIVIALASLFVYDKAITGNGWLTPYSLYTNLHTPRHVFGFNNVQRGELHAGSRVIENYDKWAENLTPALALANVRTRWTASLKWTLGLLPQTLALCAGLVLWRRLPIGAWLVLAAIFSLHAVHVPYWFAGMEDHHYVFEAGPLWAVWIAVVTIEAARDWCGTGHPALCAWWVSLLAAAVALNWTVSGGQWSAPLDQGINRVKFARMKHGRFAEFVARHVRDERGALLGPALVLVEDDPADRHIDYVSNRPDLRAPVIYGHYLPSLIPVTKVKELFPDRKLFLYRVREDDWRRLE